MEKIYEYIEQSEHKDYYLSRLDSLTVVQKEKLNNLINKLEFNSATDPLSWAWSETTEDIPQFARYLVLKSFNYIINDLKTSLGLIEDLVRESDEIYKIINKIEKCLTKKELDIFLKAFGKANAYRIINILDQGNENIKNDGISWGLCEFNNNLKCTSKQICGLNEDFLEFENEYK